MRIYGLFLTAIILPLLTSCGGGDTQVASEGGIGGTGVSQGKVSGYGSIFVNGVEFETDTAEITVEEDSGFTQDDIKLGMVVQVTGENDGVTGTAVKVEYSNQLKGTLTAASVLDADGVGTLEVMQQTVHVEQTTVFEDNDPNTILISDLVVNDVVEISGYSNGSGTIYATRIELVSQGWSGESLTIKGLVTNLNLSNRTFKIGSLMIDFSSASSLPDGTPEEGWYVEVQGDSFATGGQFEADLVELEGDGDLQIADNDQEVELEGVVTSLLVGDLFNVNGQPVSIASLAAVDTTAIIEGRTVKVEGLMVDGVVEATGLEFEAVESELQEMKSLVEAVTVVDINTGTITLMGQEIAVNSSTIMEDDLGDDQTFNLAEIRQYDYIEADIYYDSQNALVAVKLERESAPDPLLDEIEGLIEAIDVDGDPDLIRVLGILVNISDTTLTPTLDQRVDISGDYDSSTEILTANSAEVEDTGD